MKVMSKIFPKPIQELPQVAFPFPTVKGYLSQATNHQIVFMEFTDDTDIPEHSHQSQWELVLNGKVDLHTNGQTITYKKGDTFFIKATQKHAAHVYKGYAAIAFFHEKSRYKTKK
jgi:quercetin dioxygenase-like cupin family protein